MDNDNRRDGEDIGERLRKVISDTAKSLELDKLNQTVIDAIGSALDEAGDQLARRREKLENARWRRQMNSGAGEAFARKPLEIRVNWRGKVSGILLTVFGSIGMGIFGLAALAPLAVVITSPDNQMGWWSLGMCIVIAAGFGGMLAQGISQNGRVSRLKQYIGELKRRDKPYCKIEDLSRSCAKRLKFMKKDLRKMLRLGMLPDARMDEKEEWLMLDAETYRQYELSRQSLRQQEGEEKREIKEGKKSQEELQNKDPGPEEETPVEKAVRQGEKYMAALDKLRDSMAEEPVAKKLVHLNAVLKSLFETLKKHPKQLPDLEKFMDYHLPATVKLVTTYYEFTLVEFPGENIKEAKGQIEQTLDTINRAFEKLLDDMYEDTAFDVITDAAVLENMLAREGMTEADFSTRR